MREVVDRLEQRHDVDGEPSVAKQPDFLEQHADFEQVGHRLALGDDVVRDRSSAEVAMHVRSGIEDRELVSRELRSLDESRP